MPALAFALIVKNEARMLPGCIASIRAAADEIVVVDTGSDDGTPDIARDLGARVISYAWNDDFAAARNASLDACTAPWVFVIDADERLAPEDLPLLPGLMAADAAWRVTTRNYTHAAHYEGFTPCAPDDRHTLGYPGWFPSTKVRLFPRREGVRFEGGVHELVNPSLERMGIPLRDAPFPVHHYPLEQGAERIRAKRELYLRLGEAKTRNRPDDPQGFAELAEQLIELERFGEAARAYRQAVALAPENPRMLAGLGAALLLAGEHPPARRALELAIRMDPARIEPCRNLVILLLRESESQAAADNAKRFLLHHPADSELCRFAAIALDNLGHRAEALYFAQQALAADPANTQASSLCDSLQSRTNAGA